MTESFPSSQPDRTRFVWRACAAAALAAALAFAFAVAMRAGYPHELEWMEGALADHAWRVADGLPLYCEPSHEHVPFLYAPLLFWLGGLGIALGLDGVLALRLVAIASSVAIAMLVGHWVRRESGRVLPGLVASGMFLAGYGWLAWWYDLARNDSLFVVCVLACAWQLRHGGAWRWAWAAAFATAALLAKQSAVMWLPAIAVGALCLDRRSGSCFALATAIGGGVAVSALHLTTDGWSTFYLFEMPRHHGWVGEHKLGFWLRDLQPMAPLLLLGLAGFVRSCRAGEVRTALFLAAFGCGGLVTSWLSRLHVGGFDNVMMYGFAAACVLGPLAAARATGGWRWLGTGLLLAQFAWLGHAAFARDPARTLLPSPAHRRAHEELAAFVRAQAGPVWIPGHGAITRREGKGTGAHGQAVFDLLQTLPRGTGGLDLEALYDRARLASLSPRAQRALAAFVDGGNAALRERRLAAVVLEHGTNLFDLVFAGGLQGADGKLNTSDDTYVRLLVPLLTEPRAILPLIGFDVHSPYALVPNGK
jgi:hypothetical protein